MIFLRAAAIVALTMIGNGAPDVRRDTGEPLDLSGYVQTFVDDFQRPPAFYHPTLAPKGRWKTNFAFGEQNPAIPGAEQTRTLAGNAELQYYGDPLAGTGSFEWKPGQLTIVARANDGKQAERFGGQPYRSGLITTERSFEQKYGYFEAELTLPVGQGLWSAFWLLPRFQPGLDPQPAQEVDVLENIGRDGEFYATVHHDDPAAPNRKRSDLARISVRSVAMRHAYGVLITPETISWYFDRRRVRTVANKDFDRPAYLLVNLAVGGTWPGAPGTETRFPARLVIHRIRAFALRGDKRG